MTDIAGTVPVIAVDKVQAVALAVCTYYFGVWLKGKVGVLSRYSIPSPVVGGMSFAIVVSFLEYFNIVKVQIDSTLQTVLMLGFFTTIGLMASLRVVKDGGRLLLGFLLAVTVLVFLQNGMGMAIAEAMGFDKHYGILAGSVSMMGGLGTAAAFGPYFEETYGITGGTAVAVTAATFGMVAALLIGGPFGEWCIRRYQVKTPDEVQQPEPELHFPTTWTPTLRNSTHPRSQTSRMRSCGRSPSRRSPWASALSSRTTSATTSRFPPTSVP